MRSSLAAKASRLEFPLIEERHNIQLDEPQNVQLEELVNACLSSMIVIGTRRMTHSNRPSPRHSLLRLRSSAVKWLWLRASSTAPLAYPFQSSWWYPPWPPLLRRVPDLAQSREYFPRLEFLVDSLDGRSQDGDPVQVFAPHNRLALARLGSSLRYWTC